jgi:hypothetical protein
VNVFGVVKLNDMKATVSSLPDLYDETTGEYGVTDATSFRYYFADSLTNEDFSMAVTVKTDASTSVSNVAGVTIGFGGPFRIILKSVGWETNKICLELRTSDTEFVEISITGFTHTLGSKGGSLSFKVAKQGGVISVYDANGALGFKLSADGLTLAAGHTKSASADKLAIVDEKLEQIFAVGNETVVGIVSFRVAGGKNWFTVKVSKNSSVDGGTYDDGTAEDAVWSENPWGN